MVIGAEILGGHRPATVRVLIDSGAQGDFIGRGLVNQLSLPVGISPRRVKAIDGHRVRSYGMVSSDLRIQDREGTTRVHNSTLHVVDLSGYDIILGMPWLRITNPDIDWEVAAFKYRTFISDDGVAIMAPHEAHEEILAGATAYWLDPKVTTTGDILLQTALIQRESKGRLRMEEPPMRLQEVTAEDPEDLDLPGYLWDYADVFSEASAGMLPENTEHDHTIDLEPGSVPPHKPIYGLTEAEREILKAYLENAQRKGWIRPSNSPAGAPILFVPKKDGTLRLCVDYRGLNAITVKNRYPLPLVSETLDQFARAKIFTKLDLKDAYHRLRIKKGDEWKTAFRTRYGHFEYQVMPFGLANAPATFQAYVNKALSDLLDTCVVVYLDDIVIYSQTREQHEEQVREVMSRLRTFSLYCKRSKCEFNVDTIEYLGFVIAPRGITMDPDRVKTIMEWPEPKSVKEVQAFLGFANFYRNFIHRFSKKSAALSELTKGPAGRAKRHSRKLVASPTFHLTPEAKKSFEELKQAFCNGPLLRHYDPALPVRLETDASGGAIGAVATQLFEDGQWHPIAYWSRKFKGPEVRYEVHDTELLAIVDAFRHWRQYLEGSQHTVQVLTDHNNLRYFNTTKVLSRRQARWAEYLAAFDFNIEYRPGSKNPADAPSRRPDYMRNIQRDTTMLPTLQEKLRRGCFGKQPESIALGRTQLSADKLAQDTETQGQSPNVEQRDSCGPKGTNATTDENTTAGDTGSLGLLVPRSMAREAIQTETAYSDMKPTMETLLHQCQQGDAFVRKKLAELRSGGGEAEDSKWNIGERDLLRYRGAAYVPPDKALQAEIMRNNHDDAQGGHFGVARTLAAIRRKYYWPALEDDVDYYVRTCSKCQRAKVHRHKPYGLLKPLPVPSEPFETVTMDFITGLPTADWQGTQVDAILVIVDPFSKYTIYLPTQKALTAEGLAKLLFENLVQWITFPRYIVSDRDKLFTSEFWQTMCFYMGITRRLSTTAHPQTDGQTERQNQVLEHFLRCYTSYEQTDWPRWIPLAQNVYNNSKHSVTRKTPMEVLMGFQGDLRIDVQRDSASAQVNGDSRATGRVAAIQQEREELRVRLEKAKGSQAKHYNRGKIHKEFKVGEQVMLRSENIKSLRFNEKISDRYLGPFRVLDTWGSNAYKLKLTPRYRGLHPVFHVSMLEPYYTAGRNIVTLDPVQVGEDIEYVVERIMDERIRGRARQYLVHWKGWALEEATWEPREHIEDAQALDEYLLRKDTGNTPRELRSRKRGRPRKQISH